VFNRRGSARGALTARRGPEASPSLSSSPVKCPSIPSVKDPAQPSAADDPHTHRRRWLVVKYMLMRASLAVSDPGRSTCATGRADAQGASGG